MTASQGKELCNAIFTAEQPMPLIPIIESGAHSVTGPVREDNQDSVFAENLQFSAENGMLFAVADGMGGYAHGSLASSMALQTLTSDLNSSEYPDLKTLRRGVENANLGVNKAAQKLGVGRMGTTLTAVLVLGSQAFLAHIGDSRAYLIRSSKITRLTLDHTHVGDMVRAKLISEDKVRTHAQRSILTKAIGLGLFVQPDITSLKLLEGDRLILCSDGLWSVIQDHEFHDLGAGIAPCDASHKLIETALERETDDNVSVVVVDIQKFTHAPAPHRQAQKQNFISNIIRKWAR